MTLYTALVHDTLFSPHLALISKVNLLFCKYLRDANMTNCYKITLERPHNQYTAHLCISQRPLSTLQAQNFLHEKERQYLEKPLAPARQHSYLLGRYCAKAALSAQLSNQIPETCAILPGVFQQPIVHGLLCEPPLSVSIAHTQTQGAALVFPTEHPMAIDIETINKNNNETMRSQLTATELSATAAMVERHETQLTLLWCAKEALSKVLNCGMMTPFHLLEISHITQTEPTVTVHFTHFHQYQAILWITHQTITAIALPKKTTLKITPPLP